MLVGSIVEVEEDGTVMVMVGDAPIATYGSLTQFLDAWDLRIADVAPSPPPPVGAPSQGLTRPGGRSGPASDGDE